MKTYRKLNKLFESYGSKKFGEIMNLVDGLSENKEILKKLCGDNYETDDSAQNQSKVKNVKHELKEVSYKVRTAVSAFLVYLGTSLEAITDDMVFGPFESSEIDRKENELASKIQTKFRFILNPLYYKGSTHEGLRLEGAEKLYPKFWIIFPAPGKGKAQKSYISLEDKRSQSYEEKHNPKHNDAKSLSDAASTTKNYYQIYTRSAKQVQGNSKDYANFIDDKAAAAGYKSGAEYLLDMYKICLEEKKMFESYAKDPKVKEEIDNATEVHGVKLPKSHYPEDVFILEKLNDDPKFKEHMMNFYKRWNWEGHVHPALIDIFYVLYNLSSLVCTAISWPKRTIQNI